MIIPKNSEIEEKEPEELEKLTYGKTILRFLNIDGNYQIEKRNEQGVVNIIDYTRLKTPVEGVYNNRLEDAFTRIRQARGHMDQFYREKQELALRVDDLNLEMLDPREPDYPILGEASTSDSGKPMVFKIVRKEFITCDLDYFDIDETV